MTTNRPTEPSVSLRAGLFSQLRHDLPASIVVFLVATPLCLGIALASGAPLFSGIISGVVGGLAVGILSGSPLGVSGPAAGLAVIVLQAIATLGSWETFLLSVVLAGLIQLALGYLRAGIIGYYFPSSVIKGMLTGIGLIIILKQIPHAVGYDAVPEGIYEFRQPDTQNTFSELSNMMSYIHPGAILITLLSLGILILWERPFMKRQKVFTWIQGPLVAVITGILVNGVFTASLPSLAIQPEHLVRLPVPEGWSEILGLFTFPNFGQVLNPAVWTTAFTLAIVASLETLLCVEATDKLDPFRRVTPASRELKAQGVGNILSGLVGGLPVTQVIVRSSANIQSGGRTKAAAILHGAWLLVAALAIPAVLNRIPLATLAAILLMVGYKLAKPAIFKQMYSLGKYQYIPFLATVVGILLTDLLMGIGIGMSIAIFFILLNNLRNPYFLMEETHDEKGDTLTLRLSEDVSFLNRAIIMKTLDTIPPHTKVLIDASKSVNIDYDVYEIIRDFEERAAMQDIDLKVRGLALRQRNDAPEQVMKVMANRKRKKASDLTTAE